MVLVIVRLCFWLNVYSHSCLLYSGGGLDIFASIMVLKRLMVMAILLLLLSCQSKLSISEVEHKLSKGFVGKRNVVRNNELWKSLI